MIGMIGSLKLPASGIMWEGERCGAIYVPAYNKEALFRARESNLTEVEAIDGLLMITQYDIPWREDLFDKWDFYDCSQSQEFIRRGYKVVVPELKVPWCLHDSVISDLSCYDEERQKFLVEYFGEKEEPGIEDYKVTVVLTTCNRKEQLQDTLEWLANVDGISNIIVVDNGSNDGTADWLSTQTYEYLWFDEGVQGYGKVWNAVLQNFETEDDIVFLEAGVFPEKRSLLEIAKVLQSDTIGIVNPVSNFYEYGRHKIQGREELSLVRLTNQRETNQNAFWKTLYADWRMWAVRTDVIHKNGLFREELKTPEYALTDFTLRMIQKGIVQVVCLYACAYENFYGSEEIYAKAGQWRLEDRTFMKTVWGMNYFNLRPNHVLAGYIQEPKEREFNVLEVGCDLGATLLEIQAHYPKCRTYGLDINKAVVDIARNIAKVEYGDIDQLSIPFQVKFDYIIFGDVLEHLRHPEEVVRMCRDWLNENGYIIASIPNVMHISVMKELIEGRFRYSDSGLLDRTHIHFFTFYEIMNLFQKAGYEVKDIKRTVFGISEREKELIEVLLRMSDNTEAWMYETFQYTVKAQKSRCTPGDIRNPMFS